MIRRGDICWVDLRAAIGRRPAKRRPVVVQLEPYNASRLATVIVAALTTNTSLAVVPGNVFVPAVASGLPRDSVVDVTSLVTLGKSELEPAVGRLSGGLLTELGHGLRRVRGV